METKYYKATKFFSPISFILLLLCTFILGSVLSWPYLWLEEKIPIIYINILIPVGTGFLIGIITGKFAKALKMHAPLWGTISIFIGYVGFTVIKWAMYIYKFVAYEAEAPFISTMQDILTHPADFWSAIGYVNETGTWGITKGTTVTGIFLWIVWIAEIIIFLAFLIISFNSQIDIPFIENENAWATKYPEEIRFSYFDVASVAQSIERDPMSLFDCPRLDTSEKVNYVSAELYQSQDHNLNYLTLSSHVLDKKGNYSTNTPIKHLLVDRTFVDMLTSTTYSDNIAY